MSRFPLNIQGAVGVVEEWQKKYDSFVDADSLHVDEASLAEAWAEFAARLTQSYPFFHPDYAGQMLKPPHPVAVSGYLAAMLINPNNHALDGGPATSQMEKDVMADLGRMFGFPTDSLGHLTSNGTIANLEALWVGREMGMKAVVSSSDAHYTHARMAAVLGIPHYAVVTDSAGRMNVDALEEVIRDAGPCTVVATAGTTGLGRVDPIEDIASLRDRRGFRLHVDAAYGGYFRTLLGTDHLAQETQRHLAAIKDADSVVVDPHKHGLQPYGCGAVLFRDADVGRVYKHDSPYTYFTSDDLHLGEISLECSRAGAAAAALWLTLRAFPLDSNGIGRILADGLAAARTFADAISESEILRCAFPPELDIVVYHAIGDAETVDKTSAEVFRKLMTDSKPVYLSLYRMAAERLRIDAPGDVRVLRSVLMKPEHRHRARYLVERIEAAVRDFRSINESAYG